VLEYGRNETIVRLALLPVHCGIDESVTVMSIPSTKPSPANSTLVLVLGILSVFVLPILGPIAWIMGNSALRTIAQAGGEGRDKQNAIIGRNCGIVGSLFLCILIVYFTITLIIAGRMLNTISSMTPDVSSSTSSQPGSSKPGAASPHDLGLAIVEDDVPAVKSFLANDPSLVNKKDNFGDTPLFDAAFFGDKAIVVLLVDKGASVNVHDDFGQTPLDKAKAGHHPDVVAYLEDHGAKSGKG
jgi:hypothetical protein